VINRTAKDFEAELLYNLSMLAARAAAVTSRLQAAHRTTR
jgi:hypothetical protein